MDGRTTRKVHEWLSYNREELLPVAEHYLRLDLAVLALMEGQHNELSARLIDIFVR